MAIALVSKWCSNAKICDLLSLLSSSAGANAKMYDLLPLLWSRSGGAPMSKRSICCRCFGHEVMSQCPIAKIYDLLPLLWLRSFASVPRSTMCCRCFGLEVVPQCQDARFVAVGLVSKYCRNVKTYDFLWLLCSRSGAPVTRCTM